MKMISNEFYKLITSKVFIFTFIIAVLVVLYSTAIYQTNTVDSKLYKDFYSEISSTEDKEEYIERILNDELNTKEITMEWRERITFYRNQLEQVKAIDNYNGYLENISHTAETITSISIFADEDSYTYRNAVLTPKAYESVKDVVPVFSPSEGLKLALNNKVADIMFVFIMISAVSILICKEREAGIISLIKPLKKGRCALCCAKLGVLLIVAVSAELLLYIETLVIGEIRFGLGELSRPVQSVEGFLSCNFPISVFQFLIIVFVLKVFTVFAGTVIFQCLCTKFSAIVSLIILVSVVSVQVAMYTLIDFTSIVAPLASINLVAFIDSASNISTYNCINAFGYPIEYMIVVIVSLCVVIIAAVLLSTHMFNRISISANSKCRMPSLFSRQVPKNIFSYSLYKTLIMHKGLLIIIIVTLLQLYCVFNYEMPYDVDDGFYQSYCETLSKMNYKEAKDFISAEENKYNTLLNSLSSYEYQNSELVQIGRELNGKTGFERAKSQYEYITQLSSQNKEMFYLSGWNKLFGVDDDKSDMWLALIIITALCFVILPCVSYDKKCRINFLIRPTLRGENTYYKHSFIMAFLMGTIVSCIVYLSYFYVILSCYGYEGIHYSIRCLPSYEYFFDIPIWCYLVILLLARMVVTILFSFALIWISSRFNSPTNAILIGLILFELPLLVYLVGYDLAIYFCIPLNINNMWIDINFATIINLMIFLTLCFYSLSSKFLKPYIIRIRI